VQNTLRKISRWKEPASCVHKQRTEEIMLKFCSREKLGQVEKCKKPYASVMDYIKICTKAYLCCSMRFLRQSSGVIVIPKI